MPPCFYAADIAERYAADDAVTLRATCRQQDVAIFDCRWLHVTERHYAMAMPHYATLLFAFRQRHAADDAMPLDALRLLIMMSRAFADAADTMPLRYAFFLLRMLTLDATRLLTYADIRRCCTQTGALMLDAYFTMPLFAAAYASAAAMLP